MAKRRPKVAPFDPYAEFYGTCDPCPKCGKPKRWVCRGKFRARPEFLRCSAKCGWESRKVTEVPR